MANKLYVGNIPFRTTEEELRDMFSPFGEVHSVSIITDNQTGRSRGFGFVEVENADAAIKELDGKDFGGRNLRINEARERRHDGGGHRGGDSGRFSKRSW
ncbi:MAG: RNA-binding protein [Chitinivibrionales bacterium]|nr:RNA-binding protein [Chitinivibrionales bacterium]